MLSLLTRRPEPPPSTGRSRAVEEGLRMVLAEDRAKTGADSSQPFPTFGSPDDEFLVDLSDREALWNALDADGPR